MAQLTGRFTADFSVFYDAVQQATTKLQGFEAESKNVERQLNKMGESFGGNAIKQQATLAEKAIRDLGGATALTADEQKRANAILTEAIAKYNALGQQAPDDVKKLQTQLQTLIGTQQQVTTATTNWGSEVAKIASGIGLANLLSRAGTAALDFTRDLITSAGALVDMAAKTGLSVETLQRFDYVGKQAGVTVEDFAQAAFKLGTTLQGGGSSVRAAVEGLGLSWQALKKQSPDEQFAIVVAKLEAMTNVQERNKAGIELFGKSFATIAPAIQKGYTDMANAANVASTAQVEAIDRASDAWDRFVKNQKANITAWLGEQVLLFEKTGNAAQELNDKIAAATKAGILEVLRETSASYDEFEARLRAMNFGDIKLPKPEAPKAAAPDTSYAAQLKAAQEGLRNLTAAQLANIEAGVKLGKTTDDMNKSMDISADVIELAKKQLQEGTEAAKKFADAWKEINSAGKSSTDTFNAINKTTADTGLRLLEAGVSLDKIATGLKLTDTQAKALEAQFKFLQSTTDATTKAFRSNHEIMGLMTPRFSELHEQITGINDENTNLSATMIDSGTATFSFADQAKYAADETAKLRKALAEVNSEAQGFKTALGAAFADLPNILTQAFTGGGGIGGAMKALGSTLGKELGKSVSASMSQAIAAGTAGATAIGGAVGGSTGATIAALAGPIGGTALAMTGLVTSTVALGAATMGIGAAAVGVYLLARHYLKVSDAEKEARKSFEDYAKTIGASNVDEFIATVSAGYARMGKSGVEAQTDIKRALDATHVSAQAEVQALTVINEKLAEGERQAKAFNDAVTGFQSTGAASFNAMATALAYDQTSLQALGATAMTTFAALVAGGMSQSAALAAIAPGLQQLQASYDALGLSVADTGVKALIMQSQIAKDNPALIAGIDGLASSMGQLAGMGLLNADSFANMELLGTQMYRRLQSEAAAVGGTTRDALLPMQGFLQDAAEQAKELGIPLDDNTQLLIDQSKELGIWHDKGKSATDALTDSMAALVAEVQKLVDTLNTIPTNINTNVSVTGPSTNPNSYANGGIVEQPKYFAGGGSVVAYVPKGSDRVPAMLTPGERVLTQQEQREMNGGGTAVLENTTVVMLDGDVLYRGMERKQQQNLLIRRKLSAA